MNENRHYSIRTAHALPILPVLDVQSGRVVLARGGDRAHYRRVRSILHEGSDPVGMARAFRDRLGAEDVYLADLDAIGGDGPIYETYSAIRDTGIRLWVDAGIRAAEAIAPLLAAGVQVVVAGLETVANAGALRQMVEIAGADRLAFSLDLRGGRPLVDTMAGWNTDAPIELARAAVSTGVKRLIVLDLASVGMGRGTGTLGLIRAIREAFPSLQIVAGGGIAGTKDLQPLKDAGASAALVGSALHDGRLGLENGGENHLDAFPANP